MIIHTYKINGVDWPMGEDDLIDYLSQYGNVSTTTTGAVVLGEHPKHAVYADLHITFHHGTSIYGRPQFEVWDKFSDTTHKDVGEAIRDYLERKEKRAQAVQ